MPVYPYLCDCGREEDVYAPMKDSAQVHMCECGQKMCKVITMPNTDLVHNERYSSSMGVNPKRIREMEQRYAGSRYTPDGRLIVTSRKDKLRKMKERGLTEIG